VVVSFLFVLGVSIALDRLVFSKRLSHPGIGLVASVAGSIAISTILLAYVSGLNGAFAIAWRIGLAVLIIRLVSEVWGWKRRMKVPDENIFE
jgi:hypothetical protein